MADFDDTLFDFPCEFPLKAMGLANKDLKQILSVIVRKHDAEFSEQNITEKYSNGGKYISLTVTIKAVSREQLDAIYQELTDSKHFVMLL